MIDKIDSLSDNIVHIIKDKGTERPFTGELNDFGGKGTYLCRECGLALYRSQNKFQSGCGWPSFDEEIPDTVTYHTDIDGIRTEILCGRCQAHLGHVFLGENHTPKNTRHCVNSLSLDFVSDLEVLDTEEAIFAGGCFWGIEYYFKQLPGVLKTEVGYTGGSKNIKPSYEEVCSGKTGHVEAIRLLYDVEKLSFEQVAKFFFEIHDPSQENGQGPDIGNQYLSVIFYYDDAQKKMSNNLIKILQEKGMHIATKILPVRVFWPAESYHQSYYQKNKKTPYCHHYEKRF